MALPALDWRRQQRVAVPAGRPRGGSRPCVLAVLRRTPPRSTSSTGAPGGAAEDDAPADGSEIPMAEQVDGAVSGDVPDALPADLVRAMSGKGKDDCVQCAGAGSVACPVCGATGFVRMTMMDTVSASQCRLCRGRCAVPCPSCREFVYKSVMWWDEIPSEEEDPDENWRKGPDGTPRVPWSPPPA